MNQPSPNTDETQAAKILKRNIQVSTQCCENLLVMLKQEQVFLKTRDFDELDNLIAKKSELLKQLEQCALQREQWIKTNAPTEEITTAFTQWAKKNNLAEAWHAHQELFKACQYANEVNGKLMLRNQATHKQLLDILRGNQGSGALYTDKGTKNSSSNRNTLGEA